MEVKKTFIEAGAFYLKLCKAEFKKLKSKL